ncbi:MAG: hypothetical protein HY238_01955 [Acidobacteria bacterium]|nr:hypothetical protein [Acidobacteriota bacterium]
MLLLAMAALLAGGPETAPTVSAKTGDVEIFARLLIDKQTLVSAVGSDLKRQYAVVELTVTPRGGYPVTLNREDFLLRSERDNERATADSPDRVAGSAVLVLGGTGGSRRAYSEAGDPVFVGGLPGVGTGPPRRIGTQENTIGSGGEAGESTVTAAKKEETSLLSALRQKELPLGETRKPVKGYLYFSVDPNQKAKNFHLHYKGPRESCEMRFK